jgi:hypothetical protein
VNGVEVAPWEPSTLLRPLRHQINNMLAPVVVAAEILDDGSETADLLTRAVDRLRDVSARLGELLHLPAPELRPVSSSELAELCGLTAPSRECLVTADPERFLCNVVTELRMLLDDAAGTEPVLACTAPTSTGEPAPETPEGDLVLTVVLPDRFSVGDPALVAVPFGVPGADVRLAMVCREVALHGGRVLVAGQTLSVHLPMH